MTIAHVDASVNATALTIIFSEEITGVLAAEIKTAVGAGVALNSTERKAIIPKIFTSDGSSDADLFTATTDTTPLDITIL